MTDTDWDPTSITATVDLLGRTVSYTDIWGDTTTTEFDLAGRTIETKGRLGSSPRPTTRTTAGRM